MGSLLDTEGIMNHVTALVCVLCLAVGARALPSYDVDDVVAEESFKETASVNSILQEMVEAPQDALQKQQLQAPETLLQTGSAADPCAEKCLSGTCDSPADAKVKEDVATGSATEELVAEALQVDPSCMTVSDAQRSEKWRKHIQQ